MTLMKGTAVLLIVIIFAAIVLYLERGTIKSVLGMTPAPVPIVTTAPVATATIVMVPTDNIYKISTSTTKGTFLTDFAGKTLYVFDKDTVGVSNCTGQCLTLWPYYTSGVTAQKTFPANITVITRKDDGKMQFAWKGMPLYYYSKDIKPGDTLGDGIGGIWHIVKQ